MDQQMKAFEAPLEYGMERASRAKHFDEMVPETINFFRELEHDWLAPLANGAVEELEEHERQRLDRLGDVRRFPAFLRSKLHKSFRRVQIRPGS